MKRLKGPELKLPELKVPAALADLYYDLRDRRLLPLLALIVVAIVATPLLLGAKSESGPPPAGTGGQSAAGANETSSLAVVEAKPGLRDYRKRLRGRTPTDPFRSLGGTGGGGSGSGSGGGSGGSEGSSSTSVSTTTGSGSSGGGAHGPTPVEASPPEPAEKGGSGASEPGGTEPGGAGGGNKTPSPGKGGATPKEARVFTFAVDLTIVHSSGSKADGDKKKADPVKRERVLPSTVLPSPKHQVITYMGISPKTRKPLFLVSDAVTGAFGEGKCVSGEGRCQLIELEPGFPETFEYGEAGDRWKFNVTKVETVITGKL